MVVNVRKISLQKQRGVIIWRLLISALSVLANRVQLWKKEKEKICLKRKIVFSFDSQRCCSKDSRFVKNPGLPKSMREWNIVFSLDFTLSGSSGAERSRGDSLIISY